VVDQYKATNSLSHQAHSSNLVRLSLSLCFLLLNNHDKQL